MSIQLGAMTPGDMILFERALSEIKDDSINYLEIGCYNGCTTIGVHSWCVSHGKKIHITAVDVRNNLTQELPPFTNYVLSDSIFVNPNIEGEYNIVFIDGCHCLLHCAMDIINYAPMVSAGGFLLVHDTSPHLQGTQPQGWVHPERHPFHIAVLDAIESIKFPWDGWTFIDESHDERSVIGGMKMYYKS